MSATPPLLATPWAGKVSDTKLAKKVGLTTKRLRAVIEQCIADGDVAPDEYFVVHSLSAGPAYYVDEQAMLMITSRCGTPEAAEAMRHVIGVVLGRNPGFLEDLLGADAPKPVPPEGT